jgi:hypothetical protein
MREILPGAILLAVSLVAGCRVPESTPKAADPFYRSAEPPAGQGALPVDGIYPRGRRMAFMGYSGNPARDLTNGFTVAGPSYGDDRPYVRDCASKGWPVVAHISRGPRFTEKDPAKNYRLDEPSLRSNVAAEVQALAPLSTIVWWAVSPEELRCWRASEMLYLAIVCETIRSNDPVQRPIYIYNPNNRAVDSLAPIAKHVDVVAKGCYVNLFGKKRDRAWVRWSVDQEEAAIRDAGRPGSISLVMPELCQDPDPGEDGEIRAWVRHDVYLGLVRGAKGVCIWSLFPRGGVRRTWRLWYDAYAECGRELNGGRALAQVFLFGAAPASRLRIRQALGPGATTVPLGGGDQEVETTTEEERRERAERITAWTAREYAFAGDHWLFLVNSANEPAAFDVSGWPAGSNAAGAFDGSEIPLPASTPLRLDLPAYGVAGFRWRK